METLALLVIAIGLALDAMAAAAAQGASGRSQPGAGVLLGLLFGGFQAGMALLGWAAGSLVGPHVMGIADWIAAAILLIVGISMILEAFKEEEDGTAQLGLMTALALAVATSLDALTVGFGLAVIGEDAVVPALIIGAAALLLTMGGFRAGAYLKGRLGRRVGAVGGAALILIGLRMVLGQA